MGCNCGGGATAYERVWRWSRVGHAPVESTDRAHLEALRSKENGAGRIERRVRTAPR